MRLNKEKTLFAAATFALAAALLGFLSHRARPLGEPAPRVLAPAMRPASGAPARAYAPEAARDPRHSPFMPEAARPRAEDQARTDPVRTEPPLPPPPQHSPGGETVAAPERAAILAAYGYVGVASTSERACALIRTPAGDTLRVRPGETLSDSGLVVERIEKQRVVLKDPAGRAYTLAHGGPR
ncbi:MAG: hypothetical protein KIS92_17285 [Planctomycetota bacterium]|nr:hypothetical protein [Planctomycetota bacterium]